jgi:hypothetical protein
LLFSVLISANSARNFLRSAGAARQIAIFKRDRSVINSHRASETLSSSGFFRELVEESRAGAGIFLRAEPRISFLHHAKRFFFKLVIFAASPTFSKFSRIRRVASADRDSIFQSALWLIDFDVVRPI